MTARGKLPPLGAHVSVAGGVSTGPGRGAEIGAEVIQIFSKPQTRWEGKALEKEEVDAFRSETARTGVQTVAIHCAYLINLGSGKEEVRTRSLYALEDEASRAAELGVPYLVLHPGSSGDDPEEDGVSRAGAALREFGPLPAGVTLLLECTAGQGNTLGRSMERLRVLLDASGGRTDAAVCLDSAHLFEAGYDIRIDAGWGALMEEMERFGILPLVRMWHLNDSKTDLGSRVDRHQHIGQGRIGADPFRRILFHEKFRALPMVLETPKDGKDEFELDRKNLAVLRGLAGPGRKR